jgi:protein-S-isoprenylcysteine O-methyltransferase Ste14
MDPFRIVFAMLLAAMAGQRCYYWIKGRSKEKEFFPERTVAAARLLFGVTLIVAIELYLFSPHILGRTNFAIPATLRWIGAALSALSFVLLCWVHAALGQNYSSELRIRSKQQLVTWGPYRYIRHPMYSAFLLMILGMGLLSANWLIGLSGLALITMVMCLRTPREEEMMFKTFGESYRQYAHSAGRFFPRLGMFRRQS